MPWIDLVGFAAAFTVLASFCMTTIASLRSVAIASNMLFIIYGMLGHIYPVFLLHVTLLPINLIKLHRARDRSREITSCEAGGLAELISRFGDARMLLRKVRRWRRQARRRLPRRRNLAARQVSRNVWNVAAETRLTNLW
jgi:hypothetical protein